jgi:hypothetical protein
MDIHGLGNVPQVGSQTEAEAIQTGADVATDAAAKAHKAGSEQLNDAIEKFNPTESITPGQSLEVGDPAGYPEPGGYMRNASEGSPDLAPVSKELNDPDLNLNSNITSLQEMAETKASDLVPADATVTDPASGDATTGLAGLEQTYENNLSSMDDLMNQMQNLDPNDPNYQKNMFQIQTKMQNLQSMQNLILQLISQNNQLIQQMIQVLGRT